MGRCVVSAPERPGPERPGPDYPPEWDNEPEQVESQAPWVCPTCDVTFLADQIERHQEWHEWI